MRKDLRKLLWFDQFLIAGSINGLINGAIAFLLFQDQKTISLWGETPNIVIDTLLTTILLPIIAAPIVFGLTRKKLRAGRLQGIFPDFRIPFWQNYSPLAMGTAIALCTTMILTVPTLLIWNFLLAQTVPVHTFVAFKITYCTFLGGFIASFCTYTALRQHGSLAQILP
ncbi:hypothetical protein F6455_00045 [Proteobacteria bacterium 005FR1]|nr:hypothetical protein [Proteobacteria bacterium 005FR1]